MKVGVPAGIGDFSWAWSKLYAVRDEIEEIIVVYGHPLRTREYVELCGKRCRYGLEGIGYNHIIAIEINNGFDFRSKPTWKDAREWQGDILWLEPNQHLEEGLPLESWLPDLPTTYHYPLHTTLENKIRAAKLLKDIPRPIVAVSCASYQGADAWKTWQREEWVQFLRYVKKEGWTPLVVGGRWDDLSFAVSCELELPELVGKTNIGECVEILRLVDGYIGYSSGLNVIRTVLDLPAMALWPDHQQQLKDSWVPPDMHDSRRYVGIRWLPPREVWSIAKPFLRLCEEEAKAKNRPFVVGEAS